MHSMVIDLEEYEEEDSHPYADGRDYYAVYFEYPDRMKVELVAP